MVINDIDVLRLSKLNSGIIFRFYGPFKPWLIITGIKIHDFEDALEL